jgi:hypothetical protein
MNEYIVCFNVSMDNATLIYTTITSQKISYESLNFIFCNQTNSMDKLGECATIAFFHYKVHEIL